MSAGGDAGPELAGRASLAMQVLWPSFLMAGVATMLLFALVDPGELHLAGVQALGLSREAIYSLGFFCFWVIIAVACGLTAALASAAREPAAAPDASRRWPG